MNGARLGVVTAILFAAGCRQDDKAIPVYVAQPSRFVRRVTTEGNLKAKNATSLSAPSEAQGPLKIAWIAPEGSVLKKDDLVVRFDPTDFDTLLVAGKEDHDTAGNKVTKASVVASTTRTNLKRDAGQAEEELAAARRARVEEGDIFSHYQRVESQLDEQLAIDKKEYASNVLGVRESLSRADSDLLAIETKRADLKIRNAEQGLRSLEVHAPYDGILVLQRDWRGETPRVGTTVWARSPIGEIPDLTTMKAEVFVLEADASGVAVGQRATISVESNPGVRYEGTVSQVDKLARPRVRGVPVQYFGVTLTLDRTDPLVMKPGARVRAVLEVENRANAFSIPRQALFEKNGKRIVYVKRSGHFQPVEVTIGTSSPGRIVVTHGVSKGDILALTDPNRPDDKDAEQAKS